MAFSKVRVSDDISEMWRRGYWPVMVARDRKLGLGKVATTIKTVIARLDRATQYAAASRVYLKRLWNTGSPGQAGR